MTADRKTATASKERHNMAMDAVGVFLTSKKKMLSSSATDAFC